jgi:hypothetical protein
MNILSWLFGYEKILLLEKINTFKKNEKIENDKIIFFEKINYIITNINELSNNKKELVKLFDEVILYTNIYYDFDFEQIEILLNFEDIILCFVDDDLLDIQYYIKFITTMPESFLLIYSNLERTKYETVEYIEQFDSANKIIEIIKKYFK